LIKPPSSKKKKKRESGMETFVNFTHEIYSPN
jgi:hypothetical protein